MIEAIAVTIPAAGFLVVLFAGGSLFLRRNIKQDGDAPINRTVFYTSKYSIIAIWVAMILQCWGIGIALFEVPPLFQAIGLVLWFSGFTLLFIGRFEMGNSFRLGTPKERTDIRTDGLFRLSRNPMYIGMDATVTASALYTLNPVVILLGVCVISIHHAIILAEERHMLKVYDREYLDYCTRVRRYI